MTMMTLAKIFINQNGELLSNIVQKFLLNRF
jgi:hypothetical protein